MSEERREDILRKQQEETIKQMSTAMYWATKYHRNSRDEPMDFIGVPYLTKLYLTIGKHPNLVVEKSVQCGLSELFIIQSHIEASNGLTVMYVLPKYELRNRFVNNRIYKLHKRVRTYYEMIRQGRGGEGSTIHRTSLMHFGKGTLAYVGSNVESEFIEMPVDSAYVDEKDRCNLSNLLLLPDRYTASPYKFHREISNPTIEGFGIDERYMASSQGKWHIQCDSCGKQFVPDFFKNVVRETGPRQFIPIDSEYDPEDEMKEIQLICECGAAVDRLKDGDWIHEFDKKRWKGYRISKIFNKHATLRELFDKWVDAQGNEIKTQVFINSDLGLPYSSKGAKISIGDLNRCKRDYGQKNPTDDTGHVRIMGIDIGADLIYVIRDVVKEQGIEVRRLLEAGSVPSFELLGTEVIEKWNPRLVVIDALPEIHKVMEIKASYRSIYSSYFQEGQRKIFVDKKTKEIKMDRTAILDYVKQYVDQEIAILPDHAEFLEDGNYYSQMTASTRIMEINEDNPEKSRFVWAHTRPDHFFLAEAYCTQAWLLLPNTDVIDFFKEHTKDTLVPALSGIKNLSEEQRAELDKISKADPQKFLSGLQGKYVKRTKKV